MKYNCCQQQEGLCPEKKTCKARRSKRQPWKRFTCECPDGFGGKNCDEPIRSCQGYAGGSRLPGVYKALDLTGSLYEVYCYFDHDRAWTLVQSYTFENGSNTVGHEEFKLPIQENHPISKNAPTWRGYRLNKFRMRNIRDNSVSLLFTCDFEKHRDVTKFDYLEIPLRDDHNQIIDILKLSSGHTAIFTPAGKIGGTQLKDCRIWLSHYGGLPLHVHIPNNNDGCKLAELPIDNWCHMHPQAYFHYFGHYVSHCLDKAHHCVQNNNSTTQLWFGHN
jgi:hypothetical protein